MERRIFIVAILNTKWDSGPRIKNTGWVCSIDVSNVCLWECRMPVNRLNHTSWMTVVIPTERPMSVRNHCVNDVLVDLLLPIGC